MVRLCRLAVSRTKRAIRAEGASGTLKDKGAVARNAACNRIGSPAQRMPSQAIRLLRRQAAGVWPVTRRKTRQRWDWSAKPQSSAISHSGVSVVSINCLA